MTTPAPYNRDTLHGIRIAARNEVPIEEHAAKLGWPVSQLRSVCQRNCIDMKSRPGIVAVAEKAVDRAPAPPPDDIPKASSLAFELRAHRVWSRDSYIEVEPDTMQMLEMIARAAPRVASRAKIERVVFCDLPSPAARSKAFDCRLATLMNELPRIGRRIALCDGGKHVALVTADSGAA